MVRLTKMVKYRGILSKKRIEFTSLNLISIKNFEYFRPQSSIDHSPNRETHYYSSNHLSSSSSSLSERLRKKEKQPTYILERRNNFSIQLSSGDLNSIGGSLPGGGDINR